jgi:hypothetical protein
VATELLPGEVDGLVLGAVVPLEAFPPAEDGAAAGGPLAPEAWELTGPLALAAGGRVGCAPADLVGPLDTCEAVLVGCVLIG